MMADIKSKSRARKLKQFYSFFKKIFTCCNAPTDDKNLSSEEMANKFSQSQEDDIWETELSEDYFYYLPIMFKTYKPKMDEIKNTNMRVMARNFTDNSQQTLRPNNATVCPVQVKNFVLNAQIQEEKTGRKVMTKNSTITTNELTRRNIFAQKEFQENIVSLDFNKTIRGTITLDFQSTIGRMKEILGKIDRKIYRKQRARATTLTKYKKHDLTHLTRLQLPFGLDPPELPSFERLSNFVYPVLEIQYVSHTKLPSKKLKNNNIKKKICINLNELCKSSFNRRMAPKQYHAYHCTGIENDFLLENIMNKCYIDPSQGMKSFTECKKLYSAEFLISWMYEKVEKNTPNNNNLIAPFHILNFQQKYKDIFTLTTNIQSEKYAETNENDQNNRFHFNNGDFVLPHDEIKHLVSEDSLKIIRNRIASLDFELKNLWTLLESFEYNFFLCRCYNQEVKNYTETHFLLSERSLEKSRLVASRFSNFYKLTKKKINKNNKR